ncbi:trichothecene c-8 hydroxylase [Colletotrichum incanum]|uniref:Trichothecene c-8 hydroxylase n=1 Tax=Colletotrichum incanum TaxID=1573173 RepID=A0A167ECA7_COLIC|nr:trichothecene c-8 hydroxylase [Colletotrichum incanum]
MALFGMYSTAVMIMQTILYICSYPELDGPLRKETVAASKKGEWTKMTPYNFKIGDSLDADKFDAYGFLRMRETPGEEHSIQLATTTPTHIGFEHWQHACPGRFFAANEVKITVCHLLLKYGMKLEERCEHKVTNVRFSMIANPTTRVLIRRRVRETPV